MVVTGLIDQVVFLLMLFHFFLQSTNGRIERRFKILRSFLSNRLSVSSGTFKGTFLGFHGRIPGIVAAKLMFLRVLK